MNRLILVLGFVILGVTIFSCESVTYKELEDKGNKTPIAQDPTYTNDTAPIFNDNCTSCHSPSNGQTPYLSTYAEVKDACLNNAVLCRIDESCGSIMPPTGKMSQAKIDLIKNWASKGYKQ